MAKTDARLPHWVGQLPEAHDTAAVARAQTLSSRRSPHNACTARSLHACQRAATAQLFPCTPADHAESGTGGTQRDSVLRRVVVHSRNSDELRISLTTRHRLVAKLGDIDFKSRREPATEMTFNTDSSTNPTRLRGEGARGRKADALTGRLENLVTGRQREFASARLLGFIAGDLEETIARGSPARNASDRGRWAPQTCR